VEAQQFTPCPWLLDDAGAIQPGRSHALSRCGADPERGELPNQIRERRCLTGAACEIRDGREAALGSLAVTLAPHQPVGDATLLHGGEIEPPREHRPWGRALLVAALAALLIVGGGPLIGAAKPVIDSLLGAADVSAEPSAAPSDSALLSAAPTESATPAATVAPSLAPSPTPAATPTPTPALSGASGTTYVVQKGDTLYGIACKLSIGCGAYKSIAELNGIPGPDYVIKGGQVLKLP
jgi:hypothetical protein